MKLAMVLEQPASNASSYWRALQFIEPLLHAGVETTVFAPRSLDRRGTGLPSVAARALLHARAYVWLGLDLRLRLQNFDAAFVQRGGYPFGPAWAVRSLERFRGRVVYDLDDDLFSEAPWRGQSLVGRLHGSAQARYLVKRADSVFVSSENLATVVSAMAPTAVLPTIPNVRHFPQAVHSARRPTRIAWTGNQGNLVCLDPLVEVFRSLSADGVASLTTMSGAPWSGPAEHRDWSRDGEPPFLASSDVGIMPLPDTRYTRAKAGFKLLMYMGVGIPVVASPVGVNSDFVERSGAGRLAGSQSEWEEALRCLAADPGLRARMGKAGRDFVTRFADVEDHAQRIFEALGG